MMSDPSVAVETGFHRIMFIFMAKMKRMHSITRDNILLYMQTASKPCDKTFDYDCTTSSNAPWISRWVY